MTRSRAIAAAAIALALPILAAHGDSGVEPVRVFVDRPDECPDADEFFAEMRARTAKVRLARWDESARVFRVTLRRVPGKTRGEMRFGDGANAPTRAIEGGDCREVAAALAFVAALSIDPSASAQPTAAAPSSSVAVTPSVVPSAAPVASAAPTPAPPSLVVAPLGRDARDARDAPEVRRTDPRLAGSGGGVALDLLFLGASSPVVVMSIAGELALTRLGSGWISARAGAATGATELAVTNVGRAELRWTYGFASVCAVDPLGGGFRLGGCAGLSVGAVAGAGSALRTPRSARVPWADARATARVEWVPGEALSFALYAALGAPLRRDAFLFDPDIPVFRAPFVFASVGASVELRIP